MNDQHIQDYQELKRQYDDLQALYLKLAAGKVTIDLASKHEHQPRSPYVQALLEELFPM